MLRGSSRHDGIPSKQSAKDPDRDRQREQQRKERAQMLPDDKEVHAVSQDLFNAPVKVKPSIEDSTSLQIRNSLGNFEPIRRLMESPGAPQTQQTYLAQVLGPERYPVTSVGALHRNSNPNHGSVDPPLQSQQQPYRPNSSFPSIIPPESNSNKSHYQRNLYHANHHPSSGGGPVINNINPSSTSSGGSYSSTLSGGPPNSISISSGGGGSAPQSAISNFRGPSNPHQLPSLISKVPHNNQPQVPLSSTVFNSNSNASSGVNPPSAPSSNSLTNSSGPTLSSSRSPNFNNQIKSSKPNVTSGSFAASFNEGHSSVVSSGGSEVKVVDSGLIIPETLNTVLNNKEPFLNNSNNSARDAKCNKNVFPNKKPAPERADSQIELERILREMTDVIPPLTAIHTPLKESKESSNKRLPPRRSSKSEEKIVQSIIDSGMAKIPSPVPRMESSAESSSSYETDSDSESEDSASSGSHNDGDKNKVDSLGSSANPAPTTGSPTTKWNLSSFLKTANENTIVGKQGAGKSPKDVKSNSFMDISDPVVDEFGLTTVDNVTSTVSNKTQPPSPLETASTSTALETRAKLAARTTRGASNSRTDATHIPTKITLPTTTISPKSPKVQPQAKEKISSLSASSSEDEAKPVVKQTKRKSGGANKTSQAEDKKGSTSGAPAAKRARTSGQTSTTSTTTTTRLPTNKSDGDSSPENKKGSKNGQDKIKSDTIRKLFRFGNKPSAKVQSPNVESGEISNKSLHSGPSLTAPTKSGSNNRVSGKGKGNPSSAHNGDLASSVTFSDKKKEGSKDKSASSSQASKKHQKLSSSVAKSVPSPEISANLINARLKDDGKSGTSNSSSSLIVRIPLEKLRRKPPVANNSFPALPTSIVSPSLLSLVKIEKEQEKLGKGTKTAASTATDSYRVPKISQNSSRVGSSSDPTTVIIQPFPVHVFGVSQDRGDAMCSDPDRSKKKPKKRSRASPKKAKAKREPPDSHTKLEGDLTDGEVSSANVLGYAPCDSITRTPPVEPDLVQAPDSSLNPPHLPSPFVPPQVQYFSYFEKNDIKDDLFSRDQESYLEEAKKLKHSADQERTSAAQSSMYLEAGLYFILTGIIMERDSAGNSNASYTMYRDTLTLIQYIGTRWRSGARSSAPPDLHNQEAKIITLSMRCQALLFCKLFRMKMKETREMVGHMHDYFTKAVVREPMLVSNSPQLSTPSPHSPTSSPAGSSGILVHTPSPHHQQNHMLPIPRTLYNQIQKQCGNTYNCIMAHDTWEQADTFVTRYRLEDFFIGIDRHLGPLTLHSTLVDLVRYVRHGLQLINGS